MLRKVQREFRRRVRAQSFPCLGAKAALNAGSYVVTLYRQLAAVETTDALGRDLAAFRRDTAKINAAYSTFVAVFQGPRTIDEATFEELLWSQLRQLHRVDRAAWAADVSADANDPHFSFSFDGRAFYVIGMHARSSRVARRFPWPTLVFNPHEQFERLRGNGKWKRMQRAIRARDVALQGNVNPMLSDFGEASEARQYSGRAVDDNWKCPFHSSSSSAFLNETKRAEEDAATTRASNRNRI